MGTITVKFDSKESAEKLVKVLRRNNRQDREKYGITIIKREETVKDITNASGERIKLKKAELASYLKSTSLQRQRAIQEQVFFAAQGTFRGSKPHPNSPYPTATPFFSGGVLGKQIFPSTKTLDSLHKALSKALNDRHKITGQIGDWRETHAPKWKGYWSYRYETFTRVAVKGHKPHNTNISTDFEEA